MVVSPYRPRILFLQVVFGWKGIAVVRVVEIEPCPGVEVRNDMGIHELAL